MGIKDSKNENEVNWAKNGSIAKYKHFILFFGETVFNCVKGFLSLEALSSSYPKNLKSKILIDLSNPYSYKVDQHMPL